VQSNQLTYFHFLEICRLANHRWANDQSTRGWIAGKVRTHLNAETSHSQFPVGNAKSRSTKADPQTTTDIPMHVLDTRWPPFCIPKYHEMSRSTLLKTGGHINYEEARLIMKRRECRTQTSWWWRTLTRNPNCDMLPQERKKAQVHILAQNRKDELHSQLSSLPQHIACNQRLAMFVVCKSTRIHLQSCSFVFK